MIININDYRNKVLGCWMGKNIGGTLGAPMEWKRQINDVEFYEQELHGEPLPNDDLDIQLLWLLALEKHGVHLDAHVLSEYWLSYLTPDWGEYGNSKAYMRAGLMPPLCSIPNNPFKHSCGSFIRSEIWACIAPGAPDIAVKYAYEDSILDHGAGEGLYAEMFCAAIQSAAFVENDMYKLIDIGLSYIPDGCGVAKAVLTVMDCYKKGMSWLECRDEVLRLHRGQYTLYAGISERDREMGFADGECGYGAPSNIAIIIIGWLYGEWDFSKSICIAVNCGEDTDCTAATLGSIFGIINGIDAIPQKWIDPIGRGIKTLVLDYCTLQFSLPENIDELSDRVERMAKIALLTFKPKIELSQTEETLVTDAEKNALFSNGMHKDILANLNGPMYRFSECDFRVEYTDGVFIKAGGSVRVMLKPQSKLKHPMVLHFKWYNENEGISIAPASCGSFFAGSVGVGMPSEIEFIISAEGQVADVNRFVLEITANGRHTVMLIPVVFLREHI